MATPKPGKKVRGSQTGRPIMALLDLLGRRWALRVLWELREGDALNFREIRARADDLSPTVLNSRLTELREAGILELRDEGYALTAEGRKLLKAITPLQTWAARWAKDTCK